MKVDWRILVEKWKNEFKINTFKPVEESVLEKMTHEIKNVPEQLIDLYRVTNGLSKKWFTIFPIEDPQNIKRTWDSIQRANSLEKTKYLGVDQEFLDKFIIFSNFGYDQCAMFDRENGKIWFEDVEEIYQSALSLPEFIETTLKEAESLS